MVFPETFLQDDVYTQKTPSPVKDTCFFTQAPQTQTEINRYIERIHRITRNVKS